MNQNKILDYFSLLKNYNLLGSSYLFIGDNEGAVIDVVKLINCPDAGQFCGQCWDCRRIQDLTHPDIFVVKPNPLSIKIEDVRGGIRFLSLKSFRLKRKVLFMSQAQNLSDEAASAFLKTLEEAPANSFIAVCASKLEGMLPTIVSRCRKIFLPLKQEAGDQQKDKIFTLISDFCAGINVKFANRAEFASFLWTLAMIFRDSLISKTGGANNRLIKNRECEIIAKPYPIGQIRLILEAILKVYGAYNSANQNLSLNMIRAGMER